MGNLHEEGHDAAFQSAGQPISLTSEIARIEPLPADVSLQLRSTTIINHVSDVIVGLLKNALDSGASTISVSVDFTKGNCTVLDDGAGIPLRNMVSCFDGHNMVSQPFAAFKHPAHYEYSPHTYGYRGTFLSFLSAVSLLTMTSRHREHHSTQSVTLHKARVIDRKTDATTSALSKHGTLISVCNLFGNMPVRVKRRTAASDYQSLNKQWSDLQQTTLALLVSWSRPTTITLRDNSASRQFKVIYRIPSLEPLTSARHRPLSSRTLRSLQDAAILIQQHHQHLERKPESWVPFAVSANYISIRGLICAKSMPTKMIQFLSLGIHPLLRNSGYSQLYEAVNGVFAASSFGGLGNSHLMFSKADHASSIKQKNSQALSLSVAGSSGTQVDKWPAFVIRIELSQSEKGIGAEHLLSNQSIFLDVCQLLCEASKSWLKSRGFMVRDVQKSKQQKNLRRSNQSITPGSVQYSFPLITKPGHTEQSTELQTKTDHVRTLILPGLSRLRSGKPAKGTNKNIREVPFALQQAKLSKHSKPQQMATPDTTPPSSRAATMLCGDTPQEPTTPDSQTTRSRNADEAMLWTDTTTGLTYLLNSRTGHVRRPTSTVKTGLAAYATSATAPGCSTRFTEEQKESINPFPYRADTSRTKNRSSAPSPWLQTLLRGWDNPVFRPPEEGITRVGVDVQDLQASTHNRLGSASNAKYPSQAVKKEHLQSAQIIAQVDQKFILIKVPQLGHQEAQATCPETLVMVDQHAADERIKVEDLLQELCSQSEDATSSVGITPNCESRYKILSKPLFFEFSKHEFEMLQRHAAHFARWGIAIDFDLKLDRHRAMDHERRGGVDTRLVRIVTLPSILAGRLESETKLLVELLRSEIWRLSETDLDLATPPLAGYTASSNGDKANAWLRHMRFIPPPILSLVNSRACRSACMFNDELSLEECDELVSKLARCTFPFMCAHGRPSMVPLLPLADELVAGFGTRSDFDGPDYATAYKAWV